MGLDEKFRKVAALMEADIARTRERFASRIAGHDHVAFDESGAAVYKRGNGVVYRASADVLASYQPEMGLFRWGWAGRIGNAPTKNRVDAAYREAAQYALPQFTVDQLPLDDDTEADLLAWVGAHLGRAEGILRREEGTRTVYFALYDGHPGEAATVAKSDRHSSMPIGAYTDMSQFQPPGGLTPGGFKPAAVGDARGINAYSIAPPGPPGTSPPSNATTSRRSTATLPIRSLPPIAPIELSKESGPVAPRAMPTSSPSSSAPTPVREPSRAIFFPVAQLALGSVAAAMPQGFHQALLSITLDLAEAKSRFFVQLVASDARGELVSLDPSRELLDATGKMIGDDARDGNGRWRRLVARLRATARGASVDVEVK